MPAQSEIEALASTILSKEKTEWETGIAFITERIAFQMRNLIRQLRKNYWGVFDEPSDPVTQRKKVWIPLTESTVESVIKNIDLDTKDINFRAKKMEAIGLTAIVRAAVRENLDEIYFGEILDESERRLAIDGTVVWKTLEVKDEDGGTRMDIRVVDLLNFYIDPTARSIKETGAIIERSVIDVNEFMAMDGLINKDKVNPQANIAAYDGEFRNYNMNTSPRGEVKYVEMFERWGQMPLFLLTGNEEDKKKAVEGIILASYNNGWIIHSIRKNIDGKRPYEEAWYTRVPNRWYGKGIAEKVMWLQIWMNAIINIRINRAYVSQLGIFKIKKGAGITPQMIGRLASNGAILVQNQDDIEQLAMQEASQASYTDEDRIQGWVDRVTSAFEVVTGESLPASTSATATALQSRSAQSQFTLIKDGVGFFLERWLKRHALPIITKNITPGYIVRLTGKPDEIRALDERYVNELLYQKLDEIKAEGKFVDPAQVEQEKQRFLAQLQTMGENRFAEMKKEIDFTDYDVEVFITNEEIDKGVLVQNLQGMLALAVQNPNSGLDAQAIGQALADLMGIDSMQFKQPQQPMPPQGMPGQAAQPGQPGQQPGLQGPDLTQMLRGATGAPQVTAANTAQGQ